MATAFSHMPMDKRIVDFAHQRVSELQSEIGTRKNELEMWNGLLKALKLCKGCNGMGKIRHIIAQDESELLTCEKCKGSGKA